MSAIVVADSEVGTAELCQSLGVSRASLYRSRHPEAVQEPKPTRAKHPRALDPMERQAVLDTLHSERFCDQSPAEVHATLLEEQTYLCAPRTMYRLLEQAHEVRERRDQLRHPHYTRPELVATCANQVWSWDITKLKGPIKWAYFHLYVILDIFSRKVVGWMVARNESARLAERLIEETCAKEDIPAGQLTIHADRGAAMTSKAVALLFSDLGIEASHSRPHVSDDNPFSESHFRTIKYRPGFPERFGSLEQAREVCRALFTWYNTEHHHSSLAFLTPAAVHHGRAEEVLEARHHTRLVAYAAHPERFVNGPPRREKLATTVWINPPEKTTLEDAPGSIQTDEVDLRVDPVCITYEPHAGISPVGLTPVTSVESLQ
jgi:putative transposase